MSLDRSDGWRPVTRESVAVLAPFYCGLERPLADLNATMMAVWCEVLGLRYRIEEGVLYMLGVFGGRTTLWGPPLGKGLALGHIRRGLDLCAAAGGERSIRYLWRGYPLWQSLMDAKQYRVEPQATEYVYEVNRIADLPGRGLGKLRQSAACFERRFRPQVEPFGVGCDSK